MMNECALTWFTQKMLDCAVFRKAMVIRLMN